MSATALVPSPLYGLRTWSVVGEAGSERLAGTQRATSWPVAGEWLEAGCPRGHAAPAPGCECGIHAWHPHRQAARRVLAVRREVPGVVEASGAIEDWSRERGLGLQPAALDELLGPPVRRRRGGARLKTAAALAAVAGQLAAGILATDDPGDRKLFGRTGEVRGN